MYDRTDENRFPFKHKRYVFSYERASLKEAQNVIQLCCEERRFPPPMKSTKIGDRQITFSVGASKCTSPEIIKYRRLFDYVPEYAKDNCFKDSALGAVHHVKLAPNTYFEDEKEDVITRIQIFDEEAQRKGGGHKLSIIKDVPESIIRFGPAKPLREHLWEKEDTAVFAHFFSQYHFIRKSRWIFSPCQVSPVSADVCFSELPLEEDCMAIILPFRQLYSKHPNDDLLNKVCNIHKRHCPKQHPTYDWVEEYRKAFNRTLENPSWFPLNKCEISVRRYLNAFAYGARVIHVKNQKQEVAQDWTYLLKTFKKEMVIMQYHAILRDLISRVSMVVGVLRQNVSNWVKDFGQEGGEGLEGSSIFNV